MRFVSAQCGQQVLLQQADSSTHNGCGFLVRSNITLQLKIFSLSQAQASCHTLDRRTSNLTFGVPSRLRATRAKRYQAAVADSRAAVGAAAVAEAPRVDLVPKPVTSVLHDLTRFHGLPSLGRHIFAFPYVPPPPPASMPRPPPPPLPLLPSCLRPPPAASNLTSPPPLLPPYF